MICFPLKKFKKLVIGIGGRGCNFVKKAYIEKFANTPIKLVMVNDNFHNFQPIPTKIKKILIDKSLKISKNKMEKLKNLFKNTKTSYFIAGLGGNMGSKATPEIIKIAKQCNNIVVVFATLPFKFEGKNRENTAIKALELIENRADSVIKFSNQELFSKAHPSSTLQELFNEQDKKIIEFISTSIQKT